MNENKLIAWVTPSYMMQGLPFAFVTSFSLIFYKSTGMPNEQIVLYTSLLSFPWILKFLFAPLLEQLTSKYLLTIFTQYLIALLTTIMATAMYFTNNNAVTYCLFALIALLSAVHDTCVDGLYIELLNDKLQARLIGIRTLCYQIGRLISQGGIIVFAGYLMTKYSNTKAWSLVIMLLAIVIYIIAYYNQKVLSPIKKKATPHLSNSIIKSYAHIFGAISKLPHIRSTIAFLIFYNSVDAQLNKVIPLFMMDSVSQGGLNMHINETGFIYGFLGLVTMLLGAALSGVILERASLKKCLLPFTLLSMIANTSFLLFMLPYTHSISVIIFCVVLSQFFYGLCNGAYMLYLINAFSKNEYAMSFYAIGTTLMLFSIMLAGSISGWIQSGIGYQNFFIWIIFLNIVIVFITKNCANKLT